jgi:hypothetical protein
MAGICAPARFDWPFSDMRGFWPAGRSRVQVAAPGRFVRDCRKYLLRGRRPDPQDYRIARKALELIAECVTQITVKRRCVTQITDGRGKVTRASARKRFRALI